jgi:hypothetical protein
VAIVSSAIAEDAIQRDGRRWLREHHTDHLGIVHVIAYLAAAGHDAAAALLARVAAIEAKLRDAEIAANIASVTTEGRFAEVTLVHSTVAQNRAALREAYRVATRVEAIMIGDYLNSLTNAQLQSAFGLTSAQVTSLRTNKLAPAAANADAIRATTGA